MAQRSNSFAVFTASGRILAMLAGFAMPLFLTRYLSQENYGLYNQFYLLLGFTGSVFSFGMQSNLYFFYPNAERNTQKALIGNTLICMIVLSVISLLLLVIPQISTLFIKSDKLLQYAYLIGVCVFFYVPTQLLFPLFVIKNDKKNSVIFPPLENIVRIIFVISTALIFGSLKSIFYALILYHFILFLLTFLYAYLPIRTLEGRFFDKDLLLKQLVYVLPFGLAVILNTMLRQFDKMLCVAYITPEEYAIYSLAFFGIPGVNQIYDSIAEVYILNMSSAYKEGNSNLVLSHIKDYVSKLLSFSVPIILIVSLFAPIIFGFLFPANYLLAVPYFRIYILSFLIGALGAGLVLRSTGKTRYSLRAFLYSTPFYLLFAFFSIKWYGTWGAIITAMLGIILPKCFQFYFEIRLLKVSFKKFMPWANMGKIFMLSLVLILPVFVINAIKPVGFWLAIVLSAIYLTVVYWLEIKKNLFIVSKDSIHNAVCKMNTAFRKSILLLK